jgi:PEP-CTERM motif
MTLKIKLLSAVATVTIAGNASAATFLAANVVTGNGDSDSLFQNSDDSLSSGGIVSIGYFPSGYLIAVDPVSFRTTLSNFTSVASGVTGTLSTSLGAAFRGYVEGAPVVLPTITEGNSLLNRDLYVFAGNASTLTDSTSFGLKKVGVIADDVPNEAQYTANPFRGDAPLVGRVGTYTGDAGGLGSSTYTTLQLAQVVPEPSSALLGFLGALGLLRRKRS